jgi:uncharacterized protein
MVIDSHVHLVYKGSEPEPYYMALAKIAASELGRDSGQPGDPRQIFDFYSGMLYDKDGKRLLAKMEQAKIDHSILVPLDLWLAKPEFVDIPESGNWQEKNLLYHGLAKEYPDKLSTMIGFDPRRKGGVAFFNKMMKREPAPVGFKLHPACGFYPDDPVCRPYYEACMDWNVPVLIHSGGDPYPFKAKYSHPMYVDSVATDFPDLPIVIAHCGAGWWESAIDIAGSKTNVYVDFCNWQSVFKANPSYFWQPLRKAMDMLRPWRVLFGTDGPFIDLVLPSREWITAIQARGQKLPSFTDHEIDVFLHYAAKKLYQLPK